MEKKSLKAELIANNWKVYGDYGHVLFTAWYIIKHNLDEVSNYIKSEIKRSHKKFEDPDGCKATEFKYDVLDALEKYTY